MNTIKNTMRRTFDTSLQARTLRNKADTFERDLIVLELQDTILNPADHDPIDWALYEFELKPGSSFYELHMPASALLNKLTAEPFIRQHSVRLFRKPLIEAFVNSEGSLFIRGDAWEPITDIVNQNTSTQAQLKCLTDIAKHTGGIVSSSNKVEISQWMKFHDLTVPTHLAATKNLYNFLTFEMPPTDYLGNYWSQLFTTETGSIVLTTEQQTAIRHLTSRFLHPREKLLDKLHQETLADRNITWDAAADLIKFLVSHPTSRALAKRYIDALGWYGASADEPVNVEDLDQLLITAILLDLHPAADTLRPLGSFDLYSPNYVDLPHFLVRQELETYLANNQRVSARAAPLATHLLLSHVAPEFLVKQLPSSPLLGSISWMTLSRTVGLIELYSRGASRLMTYSRLMEYAAIDPVGPAQEKLSGLATITPIIDWALSNAVVSTQQLQQSEEQATRTAVAACEYFLSQLNQATLAFAAPVPTRRAMALAQLQKILPDCDYLEKEILTWVDPSKPHIPVWKGIPLSESPVPLMSMVEMHMSGDLIKREWNGFHIDIFKEFPTLVAALKKDPIDYLTPLLNYSVELDQALVTNLKLALAQLDEEDQKHLQLSEVTFYTVRTSAAVDKDATTPQLGEFYVYKPELKETQELIDAAAGRYGFIMCAAYQGKTNCYELLPLHGKCIKNNRLWPFIDIAQLKHSVARTHFNGDMQEYREPAPTRDLPLDIKNYTHGSDRTHSRTSAVILDKLGSIPAPNWPSPYKKGIYQRFHYEHCERIATFIAQHRPLATFAELKPLAHGQTKREKLIEEEEANMEFVLNLLIPFRACIQDLTSGEQKRIAQGVFGCIMDAIAVIGGVVGAASKITGIMAKTISSYSRMASIAKELIFLSIATFNPLDGLRPYASMGAKLLCRGGMSLSTTGFHAVKKASTQMHRLTGVADSYDLVKASKRTDLVQGTWIPKDSAEIVTVWACRSRSDQWHALNRFGRPWGEKLKNFHNLGDIRLPRLDKQLPAIYTSAVMKNILSAGRKKLDAAVRVLAQSEMKMNTGKLAKLLLGDSGVEAANNILMTEKSLLSAVSIRNVLLDESDRDGVAITLDFNEFIDWKTAGQLKTEKQFINVLCAELNDRFRVSQLNEGVIADDLIRAMFHADESITDLSFAPELATSNAHHQSLDVAPLLNLATGHLPIADEGLPPRYHASREALKNADSWTVLTSLLSQLETDPATFAQNLSTMITALEIYGKGRIAQSVPINLNRI